MTSHTDANGGRISRNLHAIHSLGLVSYLKYKTMKLRARSEQDAWVRLTSKYAEHPFDCRPQTSDAYVLNQIFVEREYRCLDDVRGSGLILDCGANVGYSSAYLLTRYPEAKVVAVEPDPKNFTTLERNLAPYGGRARAIRAGVWSHSCGLTLAEAHRERGKEWARQVRECRPGEPAAFHAVDVGSLLNESGYDRIFILKVDVEGAECEVFGPESAAWIDRVDNIVIELHGDEPGRIFHEAIEGRSFDVSRCGELTVCKRRAG